MRTPVPRKRPPKEKKRIFEQVLERCRSIRSEKEMIDFFQACMSEEFLSGLLPFTVKSALQTVERNRRAATGGSKPKPTAVPRSEIKKEFWAAVDRWERDHSSRRGLEAAWSAYRYAIGQARARTGSDPRTIKRIFPDFFKQGPTARALGHIQALRGRRRPRRAR
jgi:hypothetical protein